MSVLPRQTELPGHPNSQPGRSPWLKSFNKGLSLASAVNSSRAIRHNPGQDFISATIVIRLNAIQFIQKVRQGPSEIIKEKALANLDWNFLDALEVSAHLNQRCDPYQAQQYPAPRSNEPAQIISSAQKHIESILSLSEGE